jgi:hypothetical protein
MAGRRAERMLIAARTVAGSGGWVKGAGQTKTAADAGKRETLDLI